MKTYTKPTLQILEISLCDTVLTSVPAHDFAISGAKSAGTANWSDTWNDLLS